MATKKGAGGEQQPYDKETGQYGYDSKKSQTIERAYANMSTSELRERQAIPLKKIKKPSKRVVKYLSYDKVGIENVRALKKQLVDLYDGINDGVADGVALSVGNVVYIIDTGKENGSVRFGIRRYITIADENLREEYIRRMNNDSISKGYISDGLSSKFRN